MDGIEFILDVAHNPQAAENLSRILYQSFPRQPQVAFFAQLNDMHQVGTVSPLGSF